MPFKSQYILQVLITGAAGGTGRLVFEKLLNHDFYEGNALVHTKEVSPPTDTPLIPSFLKAAVAVPTCRRKPPHRDV